MYTQLKDEIRQNTVCHIFEIALLRRPISRESESCKCPLYCTRYLQDVLKGVITKRYGFKRRSFLQERGENNQRWCALQYFEIRISGRATTIHIGRSSLTKASGSCSRARRHGRISFRSAGLRRRISAPAVTIVFRILHSKSNPASEKQQIGG